MESAPNGHQDYIEFYKDRHNIYWRCKHGTGTPRYCGHIEVERIPLPPDETDSIDGYIKRGMEEL